MNRTKAYGTLPQVEMVATIAESRAAEAAASLEVAADDVTARIEDIKDAAAIETETKSKEEAVKKAEAATAKVCAPFININTEAKALAAKAKAAQKKVAALEKAKAEYEKEVEHLTKLATEKRDDAIKHVGEKLKKGIKTFHALYFTPSDVPSAFITPSPLLDHPAQGGGRSTDCAGQGEFASLSHRLLLPLFNSLRVPVSSFSLIPICTLLPPHAHSFIVFSPSFCSPSHFRVPFPRFLNANDSSHAQADEKAAKARLEAEKDAAQTFTQATKPATTARKKAEGKRKPAAINIRRISI
ncbi:hypothetical protein MVEN_01608200 [Mycena venus]|uniref:Uncharacterized protein n=1 Tax=Mycena venus TaxID=2733690 RepID=A0A8H6XQX5_9AGAR|nr:hypothetical protein MVEN_01608200 [Mycena venus]